MRTAACLPVAEASFAALLPLPRFVPLRRFPSHEEPTTRDSQLTWSIPPSGFLTLSVSCSPHDLSVLFHTDPVLGVLPSRLRSSHVVVRPFKRRSPLVVTARRQNICHPHFRVLHAVEVPPGSLGFSQVPYGCLLEISLLRGFSPALAARCRSTFALPSRAFHVRSQAARTPRASGSLPSRNSPSLSRPASLHEVLYLVDRLGSSLTLTCWVTPRRVPCVATANIRLFACPSLLPELTKIIVSVTAWRDSRRPS
jgi:hypothetical protein